MPRFYFDLYDGEVTIDDEGHELSDLDAVRVEVRRTLPVLLQEAVVGLDKAQFRTDVRDESGRRVLTATILMVIDCVQHPAGDAPAAAPLPGGTAAIAPALDQR